MSGARENTWIEKSEDVCGGDARIRRTRYTVHGLVEWKRMGLSDERILEHHPDLTPADLQVTWRYYEAHREEIEQALRAEEEEEGQE